MLKEVIFARIRRVRTEITSHFRIPSLGYLCQILNRKILEIVLLLLWFCDFRSKKANLNLGANSVKLFLREPLILDTGQIFDNIFFRLEVVF